jgi:hypothetical protein
VGISKRGKGTKLMADRYGFPSPYKRRAPSRMRSRSSSKQHRWDNFLGFAQLGYIVVLRRHLRS